MKVLYLFLFCVLARCSWSQDCKNFMSVDHVTYTNLKVFVYNDTDAALNCLDGFNSTLTSAKYVIDSFKRMYSNFYVFADTAINPPDSTDQQSITPNLGVYGSSNGGGQLPSNTANVDLVKGLQAIWDDVNKQYGPISNTETKFAPIASWYLKMVGLINGLRDAHVNLPQAFRPQSYLFRNYIAVLDLKENNSPNILPNINNFYLQKLVMHTDSKKATVDGTWEPKFNLTSAYYYSNVTTNEIKTIDGKSPLQWMYDTIAVRQAFSGASSYKNIGARMNDIFKANPKPLSWNFGDYGLNDPSVLKEEYPIMYADGSTATLTWKILFLVKSNMDEGCTGSGQLYWDCIGQNITKELSQPGTKFMQQLTARLDLGAALSPLPSNHPATLTSATTSATTTNTGRARQLATCNWQSGVQYLIPESYLQECKFLASYEFLKDANNETYGVFKVPTFGTPQPKVSQGEPPFYIADTFPAFWMEFVEKAKESNVKRVIMDVLGNGGGATDFAQLIPKLLFPTLSYAEFCGASSIDVRIGPAYTAFSNIDGELVHEYLANKTELTLRCAALKDNTIKNRIIATVKKVADAVVALSGDARIGDALELIKTRLQENCTTDNLKDMIGMLYNLTQDRMINPFSNYYYGGYSIDVNSAVPQRIFDTFDSSKQVTRKRGGVEGKYTQKYIRYDCAQWFDPTSNSYQKVQNVTNPFTNVLFLTDGSCGSSCDIATSTSYALANYLKVGADTGVLIDYISFGGAGGTAENAKKTLSATSFAGGAVEGKVSKDTIFPSYISTLIQATGVAITGKQNNAYAQQVNGFLDSLSLPQFYADVDIDPRFTSQEIYQNYVGEGSLPMEYLFRPTDFYLNSFYRNFGDDDRTTVTKLDYAELARVYLDASAAFAKQVSPNPPATTGGTTTGGTTTGGTTSPPAPVSKGTLCRVTQGLYMIMCAMFMNHL